MLKNIVDKVGQFPIFARYSEIFREYSCEYSGNFTNTVFFFANASEVLMILRQCFTHFKIFQENCIGNYVPKDNIQFRKYQIFIYLSPYLCLVFQKYVNSREKANRESIN